MIQIVENITQGNKEKLVDAKDLYKSLKVKKPFKKWLKKIFKYGFDNQVNYFVLYVEDRNGNKKEDTYLFTLDMAISTCTMYKPKKSKKFFIDLLDAKDVPF